MMPAIMEESSATECEWPALFSRLPLFPPPAHPPPALYPLLAPLLRQKLGLLSLGKGRHWPGTLTWLPPQLSHKVNERLTNADESAGFGAKFRGYRKFDEEMVYIHYSTLLSPV